MDGTESRDLSGEIPVTIQSLRTKWRVEFGRKQHPGSRCLTENPFKQTSPARIRFARSTQTVTVVSEDLLHPTSVEVVEKDGTKLTAYHCNDADRLGSSTLTFSRNDRFGLLAERLMGPSTTLNIFLDYDVKGHEAELFDTENLKSYFSDHLLSEGPLSGSASAH